MCLKLIVWALRWDDALDRGLRALADMRLMGVKTTAPYYAQILANPAFGVGALTPALLPNIPNSPATRKKPDRRSWPWRWRRPLPYTPGFKTSRGRTKGDAPWPETVPYKLPM